MSVSWPLRYCVCCPNNSFEFWYPCSCLSSITCLISIRIWLNVWSRVCPAVSSSSLFLDFWIEYCNRYRVWVKHLSSTGGNNSGAARPSPWHRSISIRESCVWVSNISFPRAEESSMPSRLPPGGAFYPGNFISWENKVPCRRSSCPLGGAEPSKLAIKSFVFSFAIL